MEKKIPVVIVGLFLVLVLCAHAEEMPFVAQVGRLMDIIINSLYTQKEIFLRELISNASDALNKIRFMAIGDPDILGEETELQIRIQYDAERKILQIVDNGVGMSKNELVNNLGTVAKSGTTDFLESLTTGDINLIGQFGVGFYSAFLVASKVEVISKSTSDAQYKWVSSASNSFTVERDNSVSLKRGTIVRLYLKDDASQYCEYEQLQGLVKRYSGFISYPIYLQKKVTTEEKIEKTEAEIEAEIEKVTEEWKAQGKQIDEEAIENSINRTIIRPIQTIKFERVNENKPLWTRKKEEIKKQQYRDFYKALFKETSDPLTWSHFKGEGDAQFTAMMFIPERASYDQFEKFYEKKSEVKLFVRRVLVNDEFQDMLPKYLNFVKCLVDSDSLSLQVSRESLHQQKTLKTIGKKLAKKAVDMLLEFNPTADDKEELFSQEQEDGDKADGDKKDSQKQFKSAYDKKVDTFNKFWKNYAKNIRLGIIEDKTNRDKLAQLTRWYTSANTSHLTSIDEIISRNKEGNKNIYFLGGEDRAVLKNSPLIQRLVSEGYEVILGDDPLDENIFRSLKEYKGYKVMNVALNDFKEPYKTDDLRKEQKYMKKVYQPLIDYALKELKDFIKDVRISLRLVNSPAAVISDQNGDTPNRQRIEAATTLKAEKYHKEKNILEINPHSPLVQELNKIIEDEPDEHSSTLIKNLYHSALIHSGFIVRDPQYFSQNVFGLINTALSIKDSIEFIQVTEEDLESLEPPKQPVDNKAQSKEEPNQESSETIQLDAEVQPDSSDKEDEHLLEL